jgi:hypothetical protein
MQVNFCGHFCTEFHRANDATSQPVGVQLNPHISSVMEGPLSVSPDLSACHITTDTVSVTLLLAMLISRNSFTPQYANMVAQF